MTRLLLIGLLTVLSFSSFADFNENPIPPHVAPKSELTSEYECKSNMNSKVIYVKDIQSCINYVKPFHPIGSPYSWGQCDPSSLPAVNTSKSVACWRIFDYDGSKTMVGLGYIFGMPPTNTQSCPPPDNPDYSVGPNPIDPLKPDGPKACFPVFKPCPLGYFKSEVTLSSGQSQCVKIQCPSRGTRVNNVFNHDGILKVGSSGTYCDGKCSYTIQGGDVPYNNSSFSFGTSNGFVCGQGDTSNVKFTPSDKENDCQTHQLSSGDIYQECTQGEGVSPEDDNAEGDLSEQAQDASVDPSVEPNKYQGADCSMSADKLYCVGTEIIEALDHQTAETKKQQDEKHNKLVKLQKEISEYVETQQRERENKRSKQSQSETSLIVEGLTGIKTAITQQGTGGSSGGGSGGGVDTDTLTEDYNPDSQQVDEAFSQSRSDIESAASDLDNKLDVHKSFYSPDSGFWDSFQSISDLIPSDVACTNPDIDFKDFHMTIDLCSKADLIKAFLGFAMIFATLFRVLYQSQTVLRIVAESKA